MSLYSQSSSDSHHGHSYHYWQPPQPFSITYIISDARSTPWSPAAAEAAALRRERLHAVSPSSCPSPINAYELLSERVQVGPGILLEGDRYLFTVQHPDVLHCLAYARSNWQLPLSVSPEILALAALAVFLHPFDPVHWLFWSNEKKEESTRLVERYTLCRFPAIYHPLAWSTPECMFRLHGLHGKQLAQVLRDKPWYSALVHSSYKDSSQAKGPTLRTRRAPIPTAPSSLATPRTESEELDIDLEAFPPPKKRARTTKDHSRRKDVSETKPLSDVSSTSFDVISSESSLLSAAATSDLSSISTPETSLLFETSLPESQGLEHSDEVGAAGNRRSSGRLCRKTSKMLAATRDRPPASHASSSSSVPTSLSSTPETVTTHLPDDMPLFNRIRSSSRLSAETLVAEPELCKEAEGMLSTPSDECGQVDQRPCAEISFPELDLASYTLETTSKSSSAPSEPAAEPASQKTSRTTRSQRVTQQTAPKTGSTTPAAAAVPPSRGRKRTRGGK